MLEICQVVRADIKEIKGFSVTASKFQFMEAF